MNIRNKILISLAVGLLGVAQVGAQTVIVDTTTQPPDVADGSPDSVYDTRWLANKFTTDSSTYNLAGVTLTLSTAVDTSSSFQVEIYSDSAGTPNASLAVLSGNSTPSSPATYTPLATLQLNANSSYWVVAKVLSPTGEYTWHFAGPSGASFTGVGSLGGFSASTDAGASWSGEDANFPALFSVTGNATVPEPSSYAAIFGVAALGYGAFSRRLRRA